MDTHASLLVYKELADCYEQKEEASMRDRFLVLAADAALAADMPDEAERLRQRLLQLNPHHMLRPYANFAQALQAPDVKTYVRDLRLNYPLDTAESLLRSVRDDGPVLPPDGTLDVVPPLSQPHETFPVKQEPIDATLRPRPAAVSKPIQRQKAVPLPKPGRAPETRDPRAPASGPIPLADPAPKPAPKLAPKPASRPAAAVPRPPVSAPARPLRAPVPPPRSTFSRREPGEPPSGGWFATLLFGLFALIGAALAVLALGRPFLPAEWLPW